MTGGIFEHECEKDGSYLSKPCLMPETGGIIKCMGLLVILLSAEDQFKARQEGLAPIRQR